jgi:hypothetical protein
MKTNKLAILPLLMLSIFISGCKEKLENEYSFFKDIDLEKGKHKLLVYPLEGEIIDDFTHFYIEDISTLKEMQQKWIFKHKSDIMPCGYGYSLLLVDENSILNKKSVNIDCEYMSDWIHFPKHYLTDYKKSFIKMNESKKAEFAAKYR